MSEHFEHDDLADRLAAFGRTPVPPAVQSAHLTAMAAGAGVPENRKWFARLRVAAALMVGFLAGSTGLAAAGVEAGVATAAGEVIAKAAGVDIEDGTVTHGTERYYGPECQQFDGKGAKNRGQYLKMVRQKEGVTDEEIQAAKDSKCGMPLTAEEAEQEVEAQEEKSANADGAKGKGKEKSAEKSQKPEDAGTEGDDDAAATGAEERSDVADECAEGPDPAVAEDPAAASEAAQELGDDKADCADGAADADDENGEAGKARGAEKKAEGQANKPADIPTAPAGS